MGKTADHVHADLAGLYLIEDENSQNLPLPKSYGINDIPLIVQDRTFVDGKIRHYAVNNNQIMDGLREETLITNGVVNAYHNVPNGWVKLRLLNASHARFYRFFFDQDISFYKIATEGGFLNGPVLMKELVMSPGERNEVMVDMSTYDTISLNAEFLPSDPEDSEGIGSLFSLPIQRVVELRTDETLLDQGVLPKRLNHIRYYSQNDIQAAVQRNIHLEMDAADDKGAISETNMLSINGETMNMKRINQRVKKGDLELWTVTAEMMPHPFHVHGISFQIIMHNGQPPVKEDRGWKDTLIVTDEMR